MGVGTTAAGKERGGGSPPITRTIDPGTPGGDLGTQGTERILYTPTVVASELGGPLSDTNK